MTPFVSIIDIFRRWLWRMIGRCWQPKGWKGDALSYIREYYPERLLLAKIFDERRFLKLAWWKTKLVCLILPSNIMATKESQ